MDRINIIVALVLTTSGLLAQSILTDQNINLNNFSALNFLDGQDNIQFHIRSGHIQSRSGAINIFTPEGPFLTSRLYIDDGDGKVGLSEVNPQAQLHVKGDSEIARFQGILNTSFITFYERSNYLGNIGFGAPGNNFGKLVLENTQDSPVELKTGNNKTFRLDENGHLFAEGIRAINGLTMIYDSSTGEIGYQSSSRRDKIDIQKFQDDWKVLLDAEPVTYQRKSTGQKELGLIAEQLDELGLDKLVFYNQSGQALGIKYELLSIYLLQLIKDQQLQIQQLQAAFDK